ncbi:serine hydrolase domain-containing protein [Nonomuraea rubra]|uniref:serine hydrolase domain-containing protein n=1 Tax=Nonomuraea rubra TaxID=46180 RepID=UPI00160A9A25
MIGHYGRNSIGAESPTNVASLSKAITAVCVTSLVDKGKLTFNTPIAALPGFQKKTGPWPRGSASSITVGRLLRHTSGITFDPTQYGMSLLPKTSTAERVLIRRALSRPLGATPGTKEVYNNVNYAILGALIAHVSGESYEKYCRREVLVPRGAPTARIGPGTRAMGAFGGWEISAAEYANFARAFDRRSTLLSPAGHQFIDAFAVPGRATAALGVYVVRTPGGRNVFHHGDWRSVSTRPREFSAFFALWDNGVSVVVTYDKRLTDDARRSLDNSLRQAAYA